MTDRRWLLLPLLAVLFAHSPHPAQAQDTAAALAENGQRFTAESLGMPRTQITLSDRMLRIFNGRGAASLRDKSVTGLQRLQFPPIEIPDYNFSLSFRNTDGTVISDDVPDYYQKWVDNGSNWDYDPKLKHPLGLNTYPWTKYPEGPYELLLQDAFWEPNLFRRTGTFHTLMGTHLVSFAIRTESSTSAVSDAIYLKVEIENRSSAPLDFVAIANQRAPSLHPEYPDAYTLMGRKARVTVVSDLESAKGGWHWSIPGNATKIAYFAILVQKADAPPPKITQPGLAAQSEQAKRALDARLQWISSRLPQVATSDPSFDNLYRRSMLTLLESRWDRESGVPWRPFYAVGTWIWGVPWDLSYTSEELSVLDPDGLRENILGYLRTDISRYVQNRFALMRVLQDYLRQTGDTAFLDHTEKGLTVFEIMKQSGKDVEKRYGGRPDGLLDFGSGQQNFLEMRTDGYEHVVAVDNALAVVYFRQMAEWCRNRNDPDASLFEKWAAQIDTGLNKELWDPQINWFVSLAPDNSSTLVWSYHEFDLLDTGLLSKAQEDGVLSHLREGEFIAPYGLYSISKADTVHWDLEDVDWGGGGQYTGEPFRLSESLYRLGHAELAWDILSRCTLWTLHYPYIPQEIFGDYPGYPEVEMPAALAASGGVQSVVFGVFGLRPQLDGSLRISPSYHHELGHATLRGYRFRDHNYAVTLDAEGYRVFQDGKLAVKNVYGTTATIHE